MEIERDQYIDACSKIESEISNLSSQVGQLDDLLSPYKETNYTRFLS